MKIYEWVLSDGKSKVTLKAEYTEHVENETVDADGYIIDTGRRKIVVEANLVCYLNGRYVDSCWNTNFWKCIEVKSTKQSGVWKIWGIGKIGFFAERAKEIQVFLDSVIEEGKTQEGNEIRLTEQKKRNEERVAEAKEIIAQAERQRDIPSREEAKKRMIWYNNVNNDGGDGYVPYIVSREEYEFAKTLLAELEGI